jgi:hypothetical protein
LFVKLFPKSGLDTRTATAPRLYFEHSTDTHRPRNQRETDDFERIPDYHLGNISPSVNSKTAITITREVEQELRVGKLSLGSSEEIWK